MRRSQYGPDRRGNGQGRQNVGRGFWLLFHKTYPATYRLRILNGMAPQHGRQIEFGKYPPMIETPSSDLNNDSGRRFREIVAPSKNDVVEMRRCFVRRDVRETPSRLWQAYGQSSFRSMEEL